MGNLLFVLVGLVRRLLGLCALHFVDVSAYVLFRRRIFYPSCWVLFRSSFHVRPSVYVRGWFCVSVRALLVSDVPRNKFRVLSIPPSSGLVLGFRWRCCLCCYGTASIR